MPIASIQGSELDMETKRVLVKEITDALEKAYKLSRDKYIVIMKTNAPDNISVGGTLLADK
jgi:phenylpyruvate tautomerase PptA (4-oxalocrotonate tautomerase family)